MKKLKIIFVSIVIIMLLTSNFSVFAYTYNQTENQTIEEKSQNEAKNKNTVDNENNQNNENVIEKEETEENKETDKDDEIVKDDETEETIKDEENQVIEDTTGNVLEENTEDTTNTTNETLDETKKQEENEAVNQEIQVINELPETDVNVQARAGIQTVADGLYEIELALDSNKVVEVIDASQASGGNVQIFQRNNAKCQKVNIKYVGNGYYTLQFQHSGMYLDVSNGETTNGTNVWQCRGNGADAQKWVIQDLGNGNYSLISKCSGTYLTVAGGKTNNGTNIEINSKKNDKSQQFKLNKIETIKGKQTITDGLYEIELALDSNKVVEVIDASQASGGNVQIFKRNNAKCQKVNIKYVGNGYYTLQFQHSGMYLDVSNGETTNGTNVWQCRGNGADAQKWVIQDLGNGNYSLISKCSGTYLTVAGGKTNNGTNIEINSKKNDKSQQFKLNKIETIKGKQTITDGLYEIELALDSNKVVEVIDASQASGGNVQIFKRNNAKCQKVNIKYVGNGYYTLQFQHSGMYLDVSNGETTNGTNVWQCRGNGADAQKWVIQDLGNGNYSLISKCSGTYLTVAGGKTNNGTNIEINSKKNDKSQQFKLNKIETIKGKQTITDGLYEIELALDSNKVVEVIDASQASGGNVQIFKRNNAKCQKVNIKYVGNGYYTLQFQHSGMYLDVSNGETTNGTNVWQCRGNGADAQKWVIQDLGNGNYSFISKCSGTYLTVAGGKTSNCTNIEINSKKNDKSQQFKLNKIQSQTIANGLYEIELALDSNKVVEVIDASQASGANVQIFQRNDCNCQRVYIQYQSDGYYTIKFDHSGKYLDVANGGTADGTNVWQCKYNGSDAQKWLIKDLGNGYYSFISKCNNKYLTVAGGKTNNCTNIEINSNKNNKSQQFKLNKIEVLTGVDVSDHQGTINWNAVKNDGIDFAIIRCGFGKDDPSQDDKQFARNIAECERLNIPYGIYLYSYALDVEGAKSEAAHALRLIKGHNPELGIWIDMEDADGYKARNGMPSNRTLVDICITFCDIMKNNGYKTGVYANLSWFMNQLNDPRLDTYNKWVAQWNTTCTYTKKFVMWQYTSDGTVAGITGRVDMDKYYKYN